MDQVNYRTSLKRSLLEEIIPIHFLQKISHSKRKFLLHGCYEYHTYYYIKNQKLIKKNRTNPNYSILNMTTYRLRNSFYKVIYVINLSTE